MIQVSVINAKPTRRCKVKTTKTASSSVFLYLGSEELVLVCLDPVWTTPRRLVAEVLKLGLRNYFHNSELEVVGPFLLAACDTFNKETTPTQNLARRANGNRLHPYNKSTEQTSRYRTGQRSGQEISTMADTFQHTSGISVNPTTRRRTK